MTLRHEDEIAADVAHKLTGEFYVGQRVRCKDGDPPGSAPIVELACERYGPNAVRTVPALADRSGWIYKWTIEPA